MGNRLNKVRKLHQQFTQQHAQLCGLDTLDNAQAKEQLQLATAMTLCELLIRRYQGGPTEIIRALPFHTAAEAVRLVYPKGQRQAVAALLNMAGQRIAGERTGPERHPLPYDIEYFAHI